MMPYEHMIESEKRTGQREIIKIRQNAARLDEECQQETERFLAMCNTPTTPWLGLLPLAAL
jgi:hypothetical protein